MSQGGVNSVGVLFGGQLRLINPDQFLPFPGFFAETIVSDPIEPGRKLRFTAEAANVFESLEKRFLREIVGQRGIAPGKLPEQTSHGRLMPPHQLREGVVIIIEKKSGDEVCIGQRHARRLGHPRNVVGTRFVAFQSPDKEVTAANQKRDDSQCPGAAFPFVYGAEEYHHA